MEEIDVTVYIPSHNYGKYLQEAIESVLRQTIDNWELLLINVNSNDNTKEIMELYKGDPRIKVFHLSDFTLPRVANFALRNSRGKYLIRLDADDVFDENILLVLSNYLNRMHDIALVFPDYFLVDDHGGIIQYEGRQSLYHSNHLLDIPANGACTMIKKEILESCGGYREDLGAQDGFDLWTKVLKQHKCANVNIPLFYYRRHGNNLTDDHMRILSARRTIKKDACSLSLEEFRPIIAVIPCRQHYDIYSDLWNKKLNQKPLIDIAIETCLASSIFDKIIITSDNPKVQKNMSKYSDRRLDFVDRSKESTSYSRSIVETLEKIMQKIGINDKGISVLSYIEAPFTTAETLEESAYTLIFNNSDSAFAVEEVKENLYKRAHHGLVSLNSEGKLKSDFDTVYATVQASAATKNSNLKTGSLTGARVSHFIIPKEESFFIRTKRDFEIAKILKRKFLKSK